MVKSDTHNSLGRLALNCRLTWSSGHGADVAGVVARTVLPRRAPFKPKAPISRFTVQRTTEMPSRKGSGIRGQDQSVDNYMSIVC